MKPEEVPEALRIALAAERIEVTRHFWDELRADAFVLADVRAAIEDLREVCEIGIDDAGHQKFEATGPALDGRGLGIVCSHKLESGAFLLITVYQA